VLGRYSSPVWSPDGRSIAFITTSGLDVVRIEASAGALFDAVARALNFPDWFGANWDALEDCLSDLSWREGDGQVLLFLQAPTGEALGTLIDVLSSAAQYWAGRRRPFFAVFIDPQRKLALPDLYREA
jgi:Tol biopolymer transport system component